MTPFFIEIHYQDGETIGKYGGLVISYHLHAEVKNIKIVDAFGNEDEFENVFYVSTTYAPEGIRFDILVEPVAA